MKKNKIFRFVFPFLVILSILVFNSLPVFAYIPSGVPIEQLNIKKWDTLTKYGTYDGLDSYRLVPGTLGTGVRRYQFHRTNPLLYGSNTIFDNYIFDLTIAEAYRYSFDVTYYTNGHLLDLSGLDNSCKIVLNFDFSYALESGAVSNYDPVTVRPLTIVYYDYYGNLLSTQNGVESNFNFFEGAAPGFGTYRCNLPIDLELPEDAKYCSISANIDGFGITSDSICDFTFSFYKAEVLICKPAKLIIQNYKNIGTVASEIDYTRRWSIMNNGNLGSSILKRSDSNITLSSNNKYNSIIFDALPGESNLYSFSFRMFYPHRFLSLDNLPIGTNVDIFTQFHILTESNLSWFYPYSQIMISYFDENFNQILDSSQHFYFGRDYDRINNDTGGSMSASCSLVYPDNARYLTVNFYLQGFYIFGSTNDEVHVYCDHFELIISEPFLPGDNSFDSLGDSFDSIRPNLDDFHSNLNDLVDHNAFLVLSNTLSIFWNSPLLFGIVLSVSTLCLISFVFFGRK